MKVLIFLSVVLLINVIGISGHGRLLDPPARSTAWREFGTSQFPAEYTDQEMFCGGFGIQWGTHGGKCSICGEEWGKKTWEMGGVNYRGTVVRTYPVGGIIPITVDITANHLGWFEFRLCNRDEHGGAEATHACLDKHLLANTGGQTRFNIGSTLGKITLNVKLPDGLRCRQCVIQWKYNTANSWGTDPQTGQSGLGFGPQEQFYGCSDVSIGY